MANVLITGGSGYLGGDLLAYLRASSPLPAHGTIYAMVRHKEQGEMVKTSYNATPLMLDISDEKAITDLLLEKKISIVFFLIDAFHGETQQRFLRALSEVGNKLNAKTHFLHTTGAKIVSSHVGTPTDRPLSDADGKLFEIQKTCRPPHLPKMREAVDTNVNVIKLGQSLGVRTYIFIPCIVYGESAGFGNKISIQTKAIVKVARATGRICNPDELNGIWPVCHVRDNTRLYAQLLAKMLAGDDIPHGTTGYYLASPGSVAWADVYDSAAKALTSQGVIKNDEVGAFSEDWLGEAAKALDCERPMVSFQMGGSCSVQPDNGPKIGWKAQNTAQHLFESMNDEVKLILSKL